MSTVSLRCPGCEKKLKVPRQAAGKNLKCPNCGKAIQVGAASAGGKRPGASGGSSKRAAAGSSVLAEGEAEFFENDPYGEDFDDYGEGFDDDYGTAAAPPPPRRKKPPKAGVRKRGKKKKGESTTKAGSGEKHFLLQMKVLVPLVAFGLVGLAGVGFALVKVFQAGGSLAPPEVKRPESYVEIASKGGELRCEYPEGWEATITSRKGKEKLTMEFELGRDAVITIQHGLEDSVKGSAFTAMVQNPDAFAGGPALGGPRTMAGKLHASSGRINQKRMRDYQETEMEEFPAKVGQGVISDYTASTLLGGTIYGTRATILLQGGLDEPPEQFIVNCECYSKEHFEILKPVFGHVVESIGR